MAIQFSIDRYLNIRSASGPSFLPDGRFVSFLTNITGITQLWQVPVDGGWPVQLTFTHESIRSAHYSPRKHELIFSMDTGGDENTQLYHLYGVGGGTDHAIGEGWVVKEVAQQPKVLHQFGGWSHDGVYIAFSANRDDPSRFDVYTQKIGETQAQMLNKGPGGYYHPVAWSPDDRYLLVAGNESNVNQDLFILEVSTGKVRHLTPHDGEVQYHSPQWSADGKSIYCASTAAGPRSAGTCAN